jgi:hypothetical protein
MSHVRQKANGLGALWLRTMAMPFVLLVACLALVVQPCGIVVLRCLASAQSEESQPPLEEEQVPHSSCSTVPRAARNLHALFRPLALNKRHGLPGAPCRAAAIRGWGPCLSGCEHSLRNGLGSALRC